MAFDFDAIRRLPPDERVEALQKLEDELKKLIAKRNDEIKQSQREIAEAEGLLARAKDDLVVVQKISMPENKGARIDDLFFKKSTGKKAVLEEEVGETVVVNKRREEELQYLTQPRVFDALKSFYETKPAELDDERARAYTSGNQPPVDTRQTYTRHKDEKVKIVSEGVYQS